MQVLARIVRLGSSVLNNAHSPYLGQRASTQMLAALCVLLVRRVIVAVPMASRSYAELAKSATKQTKCLARRSRQATRSKVMALFKYARMGRIPTKATLHAHIVPKARSARLLNIHRSHVQPVCIQTKKEQLIVRFAQSVPSVQRVPLVLLRVKRALTLRTLVRKVV